MKKILIIVGNPNVNFYDSNSAIGSSLLSIKEILEEKNHEVLLSNNNSITLIHKNEQNNNSTKNILKTFIKKYFLKLYLTLSDTVYFKNQKKLFKQILNKGKVDHIVEFLTYGSQIGYKLKKLYNIPLTIIYDSPSNEQYFENNSANSFYKSKVEKCEKLSLENTDFLICYSTPVRNYLYSKYNIKTKQTFLFPTINWNKLQYKNNTDTDNSLLNIGFIGSFLKWHQVDLLVDAFEIINFKYTYTKLYLIGTGQEWIKIRDKVEKCTSKNNIILTGFVSDYELVNIKNILDIGVMPGSNWYGGPLKIFEYAFLKIPVIAPDTPTINDIFVKNEEVLFIDENNKLKSLVDNLEFLINNREKRIQLGINIYNKVSNNLSKEKYLSIFETIINK